MMNFSKNYFTATIFFIVGILLFWLSVRNIEFVRFFETLKTIKIKWLVFSVFLGYFAFLLRALRWKLMIEPSGHDVRVPKLLHSVVFGYLFNLIIPRSGEIVRCSTLSRFYNIPISSLIGHVILERLIDVLVLCLCLILVLFLNFEQFISFSNLFEIPWSLIISLASFAIILILILKKSFFLNKTFPKRITSFYDGIKDGFMSFNLLRNKLIFIFYTLLIWLCYFLMTYLCFFCFEELKTLSFQNGLFVMVAGGLGMIVPTPSGIGSYHFLVIKSMSVLSIGNEISTFYALTVHTSQTLMVIIGGLISMYFLYVTNESQL